MEHANVAQIINVIAGVHNVVKATIKAVPLRNYYHPTGLQFQGGIIFPIAGSKFHSWRIQ